MTEKIEELKKLLKAIRMDLGNQNGFSNFYDEDIVDALKEEYEKEISSLKKQLEEKNKQLSQSISREKLIEWCKTHNSYFEGICHNHNGITYAHQAYRTISLKEILSLLSQQQEEKVKQ